MKSCLPSPSTHRKVGRLALRRTVTRALAAARAFALALARLALARCARARRSRMRFARRRSAAVAGGLAAVEVAVLPAVVGAVDVVSCVTVLVAVVGSVRGGAGRQARRRVVVAEVELGGRRGHRGEEQDQRQHPPDERPPPAHVANLEREPLAGRRLHDVGHRGHAGERERARRAPPRVDRGLGLAEGRDELLDRRRTVRGLAAADRTRDAVGDFEVADGDGLGLGHGGHGRREGWHRLRCLSRRPGR